MSADKPLSEPAQVMLLIIAANGGEMDKDDVFHEFDRVMTLSTEDRKQWRENIRPLVAQHARRIREEDP